MGDPEQEKLCAFGTGMKTSPASVKSTSPATYLVPGVQRCWQPCHNLTVSTYAGPSVLLKIS